MVLLFPWGLPLMDLVQCLCFTGGVSDAGHSSVHSFGVYMSALPLWDSFQSVSSSESVRKFLCFGSQTLVPAWSSASWWPCSPDAMLSFSHSHPVRGCPSHPVWSWSFWTWPSYHIDTLFTVWAKVLRKKASPVWEILQGWLAELTWLEIWNAAAPEPHYLGICFRSLINHALLTSVFYVTFLWLLPEPFGKVFTTSFRQLRGRECHPAAHEAYNPPTPHHHNLSTNVFYLIFNIYFMGL